MTLRCVVACASGKEYKPLTSNMTWRSIRMGEARTKERMGETRTKEEYRDKFSNLSHFIRKLSINFFSWLIV